MDVSVYENVNETDLETFSQEAIECVVNDIFALLKTPNLSVIYFCPFCALTHPDPTSLKHHLSSGHTAFLWELTTRSVHLEVCPFCPGKFVGYRLVSKHCLNYHLNILVDAFFAKNNGLVQCIFCDTLCDNKLMTFHLEVHPLEFEEWFKGKFTLQSGGVAGLVQVNGNAEESEMQLFDSLQHKLQNLSVAVSPKHKSILKTRSPMLKSAKLPVRRVLTFVDDKENSSPNPCDRKQHSSKRKDSFDLSWNSAITYNKYRCGICSLVFPSRIKLACHIKSQHRKHRRLLQPLYQCALCNAKFYKSSYLEKHCEAHSPMNAKRRSLR